MIRHVPILLAALLLLSACSQNASTPPTAAPAAAPAKPAEAPTDAAPADKPAEPTTQPAGPTDEKAQAPATGAEMQVLGVGATPADIASDEPHQYGAPFATQDEPMTLASAIRGIDTHSGVIKVKAEVEKVCQAKGCWFTLKADDVPLPVRVKMKGYAFFLPKNASGAEAVLEGTLTKKTIDQATAQHYADDEAKNTGKPARRVEGPQDTYEFTATAVQLTRRKS
jgi:hypothetical protein